MLPLPKRSVDAQQTFMATAAMSRDQLDWNIHRVRGLALAHPADSRERRANDAQADALQAFTDAKFGPAADEAAP